MLLAAVAALSPVHAQTDWGASHNLLLKARIDDDWFIISRSNLASRDDFGEQFLAYTGGGLGYQLDARWSLRAGYRRAWIRPQGTWLEEDRWYLEAYFADRWRDIRLTNRSRIEFRVFDYRSDDVRLRNEITAEAPWALTALRLRPYLEDELFYSTQDGRFEANWLGVGLSWGIADGIKLKLGYRWNHFRVGDAWNDRNVIVTGVNLFF